MRLEPTEEYKERRITVEEIDSLRKPFGFCNDKWESLKASMRPGDELWEYCDAKRLWEQLMGSQGIELRRNGEVISSMVTRMN